MHPMSAAPRRFFLGFVALACAAATLTPHAASAAEPVTRPDSVKLITGAFKQVDVLGNDSDADGDPLEVCRLADVPDELLVVKEDSEFLEEVGGRPGSLFITGSKPGTYTFTYYACDFNTLVAEQVTVTIRSLALKISKIEDRPGKLRIVNNENFRLRFLWGKWDNDRPDGSVVVPANSRARISVRRPSIFWIAVNPRRGVFRIGNVRNIELPAGVKPWRRGAAPAEVLQMQLFRSADPSTARSAAPELPAGIPWL